VIVGVSVVLILFLYCCYRFAIDLDAFIRIGENWKILSLEFEMYTFIRNLQFSTLFDGNGIGGLIALALGNVLDFLHDIKAFENFAEDNVAAIKPIGNDGGDKKIGIH